MKSIFYNCKYSDFIAGKMAGNECNCNQIIFSRITLEIKRRPWRQGRSCDSTTTTVYCPLFLLPAHLSVSILQYSRGHIGKLLKFIPCQF